MLSAITSNDKFAPECQFRETFLSLAIHAIRGRQFTATVCLATLPILCESALGQAYRLVHRCASQKSRAVPVSDSTEDWPSYTYRNNLDCKPSPEPAHRIASRL